MKSNFLLIKTSLILFILVLPIIGYCNVDYNHKQDLVYGYKDGMALVMDIYTPQTELNKAGVIVVIAGGLSSNPINSHSAGNRHDVQKLLQAGYVVFAVTHCSQPKYTIDEIRNDIPRAVRFIRFNANQFGIDSLRLGVIGYSSGGHVSLMAGVSSQPGNDTSYDPVEKVSSKLQAVVAYFPSTDLLNFGTKNTTIVEHFHSIDYRIDAAFDFHTWDNNTKRYERITDIDTITEYYRKNSPVTFVSEDDPPKLLVHGDKDRLVPIQQSDLFIARLKEMNVPNKLLAIEGKGHGFNFRNPEEDKFEEVLIWFEQFLLKKE